VKEAEDPAKAKNAAAVIESVIRKHRTQESYNRIRKVMRPNSGGGLQRVDVPKRDDDGNVLRNVDGEEIQEVLLYARLRMEIIEKRPHFCLTRQINMLYDC
jgi:hypothetical protein